MSEPDAPATTEEGPPEVAYRRGRSPFRQPPKDPLLERALPLSAHIPGYRPGTARRDLLAGLTVAALAVPAAMAYAEVAGLPPVNGLYALLLPTVLYTFLGSSRQLIVGPEGSVSALVGAAIIPIAVAGSTHASELGAMLALLVAACFLLAWAARLGWLADYFSRPVIIGYLHGVAVVLVCSQLGKLLGVTVDARRPIGQIVDVVQQFGDYDRATVLVSIVALAVLLTARIFVPFLPAALIVVVASIVLSWAIDLHAHGVAITGPIPAGLPSFSSRGLRPPTSSTSCRPRSGSSSSASPTAFSPHGASRAGTTSTSVRTRSCSRFAGIGAAAGVTSGFPLGASGSRTTVNDQMGARTQIAGLIAAGAVALVLVFFTGPMQYLPKAVLGAVIVSAATGLVDSKAWRDLIRVSRFEVGIAAATTSA